MSQPVAELTLSQDGNILEQDVVQWIEKVIGYRLMSDYSDKPKNALDSWASRDHGVFANPEDAALVIPLLVKMGARKFEIREEKKWQELPKRRE